LRIPADWLSQAFKCKHCGLIIQARTRTSPVAVSPVVSTPKPVAIPVGAGTAKPVARPVAQPAVSPAAPAPARTVPRSTGDPFAFDDEPSPESPSRPRRGRRSRGGLATGLILAGVVLGITIVATAFAWPHLSRMIDQPPDGPVAQNSDSGKQDGGGTSDLPDDLLKYKPPQRDTRKSDIPIKHDTGKKPEKHDPSTKRDTGSKPDLPVAAGPFPRRLLAISINNYLFANPIFYGMPIPSAANVQTLLDKLSYNNALHIPADQVALLSDMASDRIAQPPTEAVIRNTIVNFLDTSRAQDRIILLIVGHVVEIDNEAVLLPIDGMIDSKEGTIPLKWIYERLAACKARQKVLILDTCRLDPAKGQERPGSGPMSATLDKMLQEPPPGVQVWSSCVAEQFSYEFEGGEKINNGLFLQALYDVVPGNSSGGIQEPGDPLPLTRLVTSVNLAMKQDIPPGKEQKSRLSGKMAEEGAAYDPKEPRPPRLEIPPSPRSNGGGDLAVVRSVLKDISFPPLKVAKDSKALSAESLPPFPEDALKEYAKDGEATPLREAVMKARTVLADIAVRHKLKDFYKVKAEAQLKQDVRRDQKEVAIVLGALEEASDALKAVEVHRKNETKRWQATYDYVVARLEAQQAYLNEYEAVLGQILKGLAPPDPKLYDGWRLASQYDSQTGDSAAKKIGAESRKKMDKIIKAYPNTPWAIMARRDKTSGLGLEWQPMKK
jgi:hypothetical protein